MMARNERTSSGDPLKGVLIDLWGTLAPVRPALRPVHLREMARTLGAEPVAFERAWQESLGERCLGALGPLESTIERVARRSGVEPAPELVRRALEIRLSFTRSTLEASLPLLPALDALKEDGLKLAVVSDASEEVPRLWPSIPLGARFEAAVFSCQNGFCKPDPRAYRLALTRLGLAADACAYVGDGDSEELSGAEAVGLSAYLFRFPGQAPEPEYRSHPDLAWRGPVLRHLEELRTLSRLGAGRR